MTRMLKRVSAALLLATVIATSAMTAMSPAVHAADDVLRVRARQGKDIHTMDPAHYLGNEEYNVDLAIYSKLVQFKPGSSELRLDAAESLHISEDGTVIEFTLRPGIQFHYGYGEMTAEDVKFSLSASSTPRSTLLTPRIGPFSTGWKSRGGTAAASSSGSPLPRC